MENGENKCRDSIESILTDILSKSNPLTKRGFYFRQGCVVFRVNRPFKEGIFAFPFCYLPELSVYLSRYYLGCEKKFEFYYEMIVNISCLVAGSSLK